MIPTSDLDLDGVLFQEGAYERVHPSLTHKMQIEDEHVIGMVDDREALEQMIYKNINTEPDYEIYANFGVKKKDLYGKPKPYAYMEITRRIKEVLELDDRVHDVHSFYYMKDWSKGSNLGFKFTVSSVYGEIEIKEVIPFELAGIGD